jgi:hypothetical protein
MNKLKTEEKKSLEGNLKYVIPYTYILTSKHLRLENAMSYRTWINTFCKLLLTTPP